MFNLVNELESIYKDRLKNMVKQHVNAQWVGNI